MCVAVRLIRLGDVGTAEIDGWPRRLIELPVGDEARLRDVQFGFERPVNVCASPGHVPDADVVELAQPVFRRGGPVPADLQRQRVPCGAVSRYRLVGDVLTVEPQVQDVQLRAERHRDVVPEFWVETQIHQIPADRVVLPGQVRTPAMRLFWPTRT